MIYSVLFVDLVICVLLYVDAQAEVDNVPVVKEPVFSKPLNLSVMKAKDTSIELYWTAPDEAVVNISGYHVYYMANNHTSKKEVLTSQPVIQYTLNYLYYKIWVKAFSDKNLEGAPSDAIMQRTDVSGPGPPRIMNVTCIEYNTLFVQWERPSVFYNNIDVYYILYRSEDSFRFQRKEFSASNNKLETTLTTYINNLTDNTMYEIKVLGATRSLFSTNNIAGNASESRKVLISNCDNQNTYMLSAGVIAGIVCVVFALLLGVCAFIIWRNWLHAAYYYLEDPVGPIVPMVEPDWEAHVDPDSAVPVSRFAAHVAELHADGDIGFSREYEAIQATSTRDEYTTEHSQYPDNKLKNRYLNILAYDHSRVRLLPVPGQGKSDDYINANYIDGFHRSHAYIGTQGPLPITFDAFWRMVWEQGVAIIVMITNLVERGRRKCDMYWPKEGTETYGLIQVKLVREDVLAMYTVRTLEISRIRVKKKKKHNSPERVVYQYHYTNWPDHGTPDHPLPILSFVNKSSFANPSDAGPIVVHCSAGVGRTGTYIVLDAMLKQIFHKNKVNVYGYLSHIRSQRNFLVQTEEQYIFIHDALLEAIVCSENNLSPDCIAELIRNPDPSNVYWDKLVAHFKMVTSFEPKEYNLLSAKKSCNVSKNRSDEFLPVESSRVHLTRKPGVDGSDYINASWFLGFKKLREFIITQHPLESTVIDFWQMVWDHNAQTIVLLSSVDSNHLPSSPSEYGIFWPRENETTLDGKNFKVKCVEEGTVSRDLTVQSLQDDYELAVRIIEPPSSSNQITSDLPALVNLLNIVHKWHLEYQNGPIIVVDRYGGTEAGTFCCLATLTKQIEFENQTDVCMYAKLYHNRRPGIWKSVNDYLLLYRALDYLSANKGVMGIPTPIPTTTTTTTITTTTTTSPLHPNGYSNGGLGAQLNSV
ncbi:protein tyrosine phosphatase 99A isoform X2 [Lycorma delicatula]|uniref:protein tyrosine phosphatase 99A isoform X2 n=1 Tax=Lycorma delicatula TaxID=130591 RepID=UPI003F5192BB